MNLRSFRDALEECYDTAFGLSASEQAKYRLIGRYQDKVSARLLNEKAELREKCRGAFGESVAKELRMPNPFLARIKKDTSFGGKHLPVPILNHSDGKNMTDIG